jgi:hypothetical protein
MSVLKTVKCPACGSRHLLGRPCRCGGRQKPRAGGSRAVGVVLTFVLTALGIVAASLALAGAGRPGYGVALAVGAWLLVHLCRLGYDWEDGIDIRQLFFPGPFDWPVKIESLLNFWTSPRAQFRAVYLGTVLALIVVVVILLGGKAAGG